MSKDKRVRIWTDGHAILTRNDREGSRPYYELAFATVQSETGWRALPVNMTKPLTPEGEAARLGNLIETAARDGATNVDSVRTALGYLPPCR